MCCKGRVHMQGWGPHSPYRARVGVRKRGSKPTPHPAFQLFGSPPQMRPCTMDSLYDIHSFTLYDCASAGEAEQSISDVIIDQA